MDSKSFSTPKRDRSWHQQLNNTSPLSDSSSSIGAKRRKLNIDGSSITPVEAAMPASGSLGRPVKALQVFKSAIGGVFGLGKARENISIHERLETNHSVSKYFTREPDYSDEPDELSRGDERDDQIPGAAGIATIPLAESTRLEELGNEAAQSPISKRKTKKPRPSDITADAKSEEDDELTIAHNQMTENTPPSMKRVARVFEGRTGIGRHQSNKLFDSEIVGKGRPRVIDMALEEDTSPGGARSSGRKKKRPRRYSTEIATEIKRPPKGILTPSKMQRGRPRKSVVFEEDSVRSDHGLDIQKTNTSHVEGEMSSIPKKKRGRPRKIVDPSTPEIGAFAAALNRSKGKKTLTDDKNLTTSELDRGNIPSRNSSGGNQVYVSKLSTPEDAITSDEDDTKCIICKGGESEYPNEILLCDSCELAAHQVCYGVDIIPKGDWMCRDCRPEEDEELLLLETGTHSESILGILSSKAPEIEGVEYHLQVMQKLLLDKLTGRRQFKLYDLDEEYRKVHQIVEQTVLAGEGNSMLVIGARGCGKTTLVESVLADISNDHRQDFHIVRLNGFIHTDDKLALREIWRQLGREMKVEDEVISKTNNYADTLASLLALLSHPSELSGVETDHIAKAVIFILDEFDLFTSHPRQTLLYNLFDIAQARKAPIAVLGVTTKIDVVERLEKRVKSRFSHRYVHLPLPRSLAAYWEICRQGLLVEKKELVEEGFSQGLTGQDEFLSFWESMINDLYHKDSSFKHHLQLLYYRSKSVPSFLTTCILPVANLTPRNLPLTGSSFATSASIPSLQPPDSKLHLLPSLADVDLALLIAAARLNVILDTENCNFSMAYDEYCSLTSKHKIQAASSGSVALGASTKVWGREVALGAWERLVEYELLVPAGVGTMAAGRDTTGREVRMWRVDVGLEEISGSVELVGVMGKWCREI